ncbi:hypothetical protein POSPLADRAFT_1074679 [Postia placenta MAD-698-R-SB12]|uniref:Uncharacterized protein n=1 Tax=Postia placenta MAD-698-R-SB12 TaxID=670580 RepID=A0A1X6N069_9APHY|nr:hypothetical protein POSPLADRAFT_1074679 [Postia placenta MAD-698-R-SB12]OSX61833.1 hypothetical protein POSPLADRAFT_1074679 [Postia placenta MAD-698-R-SB12]
MSHEAQIAKLQQDHTSALVSLQMQYREMHAHCVREVEVAQTTIATQARNINGLQRALDAITMERDNATALLQTRTEELRGADAYLSKTDSVPEAQTAALIADKCAPHLGQNVSQQGAHDQATVQRMAGVIGEKMTGVLQPTPGREDPISIQLALQACLVVHTRHIIQKWGSGASETNRALQCAWESLYHAETQTVAGRWRALTRRYLRQGIATDGIALSSSYTSRLATDCAVILEIAGMPRDLRDGIEAKCSSRLSKIVDLALGLQTAIGEDVITCELDILTAKDGAQYDPRSMEDEYRRPGDAPEASRVLCVIGMGLSRREKVVGRGGIAKWYDSILLLLKSKITSDIILDQL